MPIYPFYCNKCQHKEELFLKMADEKPTICPVEGCGGEYIRDYSGISAVVDASQAKTIGDLADRNTERMVKEGKLPKETLSWDTKRKEIRNPCVLDQSGFAFCYQCISDYINEQGCCPITKVKASLTNIRKIYDS